MTRRSAMVSWLGWSLAFGLLPLGLGWIVVWVGHISRFPSLDEPFGSGRPALTSIGLLVPGLRQAMANPRAHWMVPWLTIVTLLAVGLYAAIASHGETYTDQNELHAYAALALVVLGACAAVGGMGVYFAHEKSAS